LKVRVPLIGIVGAPWTLMAYMVQGGGSGSKSFDKVRAWLYKYPEASGELLDLLTNSCIDFLVQQALHGAQILEIFDTWAGDLSEDAFRTWSLPRLKRIATEVKTQLKKHNLDPPMTIFAKGAHFALEDLAETDYDVVALDWTMDPQKSRQRLTKRARELKKKPQAIQGNLDPAILYAPKEVIEEHAKKLIDGFGTRGYIFNLGHGMLPDHSPEAVGWLLDAIYNYSIAKVNENKATNEGSKKKPKGKRKKAKTWIRKSGEAQNSENSSQSKSTKLKESESKERESAS